MNSFIKSTFEIPKGRLFSLACLTWWRRRLTVTCRTLAAVQGSNRIASGASDVTLPDMHRVWASVVILTLGSVLTTSHSALQPVFPYFFDDQCF